MNTQNIFYKTQRIKYYELFTHTLKDNNRIFVIYFVEWHTLDGIVIRNEIEEEEYEALLQELEHERQESNNI